MKFDSNKPAPVFIKSRVCRFLSSQLSSQTAVQQILSGWHPMKPQNLGKQLRKTCHWHKNAPDSHFVTSLYLILGAIYNFRDFPDHSRAGAKHGKDFSLTKFLWATKSLPGAITPIGPTLSLINPLLMNHRGDAERADAGAAVAGPSRPVVGGRPRHFEARLPGVSCANDNKSSESLRQISASHRRRPARRGDARCTTWPAAASRSWIISYFSVQWG